MFGALAFRQVLDNLDVRRLRMGEDRKTYLSAPATCIAAAMLLVSGALSLIIFTMAEPRIYTYALPMILVLQSVQFLLRIIFQRLVAKTHGLVIPSVLFDALRTAPYSDITRIESDFGRMWVTVSIDKRLGERIMFRIFRVSAPSLIRILRSSCTCGIHMKGRFPNHDYAPN